MQGRDRPLSLINISARANTSQEAPKSGSSSHLAFLKRARFFLQENNKNSYVFYKQINLLAD